MLELSLGALVVACVIIGFMMHHIHSINKLANDRMVSVYNAILDTYHEVAESSLEGACCQSECYDDQMFTTKEAADYLEISYNRVGFLRYQGNLVGAGRNRETRYSESELARYKLSDHHQKYINSHWYLKVATAPLRSSHEK